jgi:hypothetical protein
MLYLNTPKAGVVLIFVCLFMADNERPLREWSLLCMLRIFFTQKYEQLLWMPFYHHHHASVTIQNSHWGAFLVAFACRLIFHNGLSILLTCIHVLLLAVFEVSFIHLDLFCGRTACILRCILAVPVRYIFLLPFSWQFRSSRAFSSFESVPPGSSVVQNQAWRRLHRSDVTGECELQGS